MENFISDWNWFLTQNTAMKIVVATGCINIVIAGLKQLGLTYLADVCQKIENALIAMSAAAKTAFVSEIMKPTIK